MAYPLLPAGIVPHEPLNDSYAVKLANPYLRSDYDDRLARQVRKYRNAPTTYAIKWPLNPAQLEILMGWLEDAAGGPGEWFDLNVFRGDVYERMTVRFVMPIDDVTREGGEWMWSGHVETMSYAPRDATATASAMLTYGGDMTLDEAIDLLHRVVHVIYPAACP